MEDTEMKEIMTRAWEIYRTLEGDRLAKLAMALRQAWAEAKDDTLERVEQVYYRYTYGQVSRFEAGVIYKAMKQGAIKISKKAVNALYSQCDKMYRFASERYHQNHNYYDGIIAAVKAILIGEYAYAQKQINNWIDR
jgi:hypothetical protein